jgi:3-carboxy-cis,cis-muconate cycloisomerase
VTARPTFDSGFTTPELSQLFSDQATVAALLEFEAALALSLVDTGIAPQAAAEEVSAACRAGVPDPAAILDSTWETGTPLLALRQEVTAGMAPESAQWFHYGATTQDAVDTGLGLQSRQGLSILEEGLLRMVRRLVELTTENRDRPQTGRTFLQPALPTTFGLRTAGWLASTLDRIAELRAADESLQVQLGGSNGTLSAYGDRGATVVSALATRLGLRAPDVTWHADRTSTLSMAQTLGRVAATMGKIATDVAILTSPEIAEITVRSGGSSSMPAKENPLDPIRARAAAAACTGAVAMLGAAPSVELDRGVGGWHVEWLAIPLAFQTCGASVEAMRWCLDSVVVDADRMESRAPGPVSPAIGPQIDAVLARASKTLETIRGT